ncbi:hypothetical protein [Nocardioides convexus]|uniref:hypothetical protein n=1 Tax=Nocardioides convexus TaxID=2712224 RepID=UPI0024185DA2|nr:hypothetical protein [Nocardioides convexus]
MTERSGRIEDGGVVLAWCPRHKTLEKSAPPREQRRAAGGVDPRRDGAVGQDQPRLQHRHRPGHGGKPE